VSFCDESYKGRGVPTPFTHSTQRSQRTYLELNKRISTYDKKRASFGLRDLERASVQRKGSRHFQNPNVYRIAFSVSEVLSLLPRREGAEEGSLIL